MKEIFRYLYFWNKIVLNMCDAGRVEESAISPSLANKSLFTLVGTFSSVITFQCIQHTQLLETFTTNNFTNTGIYTYKNIYLNKTKKRKHFLARNTEYIMLYKYVLPNIIENVHNCVTQNQQETRLLGNHS